MMQYVLGFCFNKKGDTVKLVRKNRPEWQKGKLNGIGGKVEKNEQYVKAMEREFLEEAGVEATGWEYFVRLRGNNWRVHVFRLFSDEIFSKTSTQTDEPIESLSLESLLSATDIIINLQWLIPLARNSEGIALPLIVDYID